MMPLVINDGDVNYAEDHFGLTFSEDQRTIIKCLESVDIHACPGSGKTTTLAAKLLILLRRIPETHDKGICVITHTNVAVEAIKEKIGHQAIRLFSYPNHFGTIQSFVDKYLTIPAYRNHFKKSPCKIDDSTYEEVLGSLPLNSTAQTYLSRKRIELEYLVFNLDDFAIGKNISETSPFVGRSTPTYTEVERIKKEVLKQGYLKFDESYSMGIRWLKRHPQLYRLFSLRFPYVFIDEMQDMAYYQEELLKLAIGNCPVVQRIGDKNQAIYSSASQTDDQSSWNLENTLSIQKSCRFSEAIASCVKNVCVAPVELGGRSDLPQILPKAIVYDNDNINHVKTKFAQLILKNNLRGCGNGIFKAIGFRKSDSRLNINSYYPEYSYATINSGESLPMLSSYLRFDQDESIAVSVAKVKGKLLPALCKILRLQRMKHPVSDRDFAPSSLWKHMREDHIDCFETLCQRLLIWPLRIGNDKLLSEVGEWITTTFLPSFGLELDEKTTSFLDSTNSSSPNSTSPNTAVNVYRYRENGQEVAIEFNTIHGVKGETHCATLYLETYTRCYDIHKIIPFFLGETKGTKRTQEAKRLRPGYVAITRPSHMLCLAVHADRFTDANAVGMEQAGWEVVRL